MIKLHCSTCKENKPIKEFHTDKKMRRGFGSQCKGCKEKSRIKHYKTVDGILSAIYTRQATNAKKRTYLKQFYSSKEFKKQMLYNPEFRIIYTTWVNSGYKRELTPSCDRIDKAKGFTLDNIKAVIWSEYERVGHTDMQLYKTRRSLYLNKIVVGININTSKILTFSSVRSAERKTGISQGNISANCHGWRKSAGGYKWEYK